MLLAISSSLLVNVCVNVLFSHWKRSALDFPVPDISVDEDLPLFGITTNNSAGADKVQSVIAMLTRGVVFYGVCAILVLVYVLSAVSGK